MKRIYFDYAAATPIDPEVNDLIFNYSKKFPGNASSLYASGRASKQVIKEAKAKIGKVINSSADEVIATGSGTESDNLAIFGVARSYLNSGRLSGRKTKRHIIISAIEHMAVMRACDYLEKYEDFKITRLPVNKKGIVDVETLQKALSKDTILVSVMYANNEIGTIQPVAKIAKEVRNYNKANSTKILLHTDACQAAGALDLDVQKLGVDLMTLNGSKIYGPRGTGALFVRRGVRLVPITVGGSQERGLRAGTENPALIAGLAKALELADSIKIKEGKRLVLLRDHTISRILEVIPDARLNGDSFLRLPNNINLSFKKIDGEMMVYALDGKGIEVSTGSACTSTSMEQSHVIKALGNSRDYGNLRITLGRQTTKNDLNYLIKILPQVIKKIGQRA